MADEPALIIQVPRDSAIERQLRDGPPASVRADDVVVQTGRTEANGLERGTRNPDRGKQVSLSTSDDAVLTADAVAALAGDHGRYTENSDNPCEDFWGLLHHSTIVDAAPEPPKGNGRRGSCIPPSPSSGRSGGRISRMISLTIRASSWSRS